MSTVIKTVETGEIFVAATVINAFLTRGIYKLSYSDVVSAAAGALGTLKEATFRRWLRNPLWKYDEYGQMYTFRYGMKPKVFTSPASDFGLELIFEMLGVDDHVRWIRIWSSHFTNGGHGDEKLREEVIKKIDAFVRECRKAWRSSKDKEAILSELSATFRNTIMPECCAYRGCHGIMTQPAMRGKKTLVYIPRSRVVPAAARRMSFKPSQDVIYV